MSSGPASQLGAHRILVAVLVGVGLLLGLSFPLALGYDEDLDRQRAGYNDASAVVRMQQQLIARGEPAKEFDIGPDGEVRIGDQLFRPRPGNRVVSIVDDEGLCVQVTNEDPNIRAWTYDSADGEHPYDDIPRGACG